MSLSYSVSMLCRSQASGRAKYKLFTKVFIEISQPLDRDICVCNATTLCSCEVTGSSF